MLSESELDDQLHQSNPVNRAALDDEGVRAALTSIRHSVMSHDHRPALPHARKPVHRRRSARLAMATAAVAVASLAGVETLTGGAGSAGLPLAVSPAAAAQLNRVAHAAAGQPSLGAGQFAYLESELETTADPSVGNASVDYTYDERTQEWDGPMPGLAGRQLITSDGIVFATAQDHANYLANESAFDSAFSQSFPTDDPTATGLVYDHVLPPHGPEDDGHFPSQIAKEVAAGTERPDGPHALLSDLTAALDAQPADLWAGLLTIVRSSSDAQLRATAYEALAYVHGTKVLGDRRDQLGRVGVAIQFTDYVHGPTDTLIVSPATGYLLQLDIATQTSDGPSLQREVDMQRGIVNSLTALPGGGSQPFTAATQTVNLMSGTATPTLQTTTTGAPSTTSSAQTTAPQTTTTSSAQNR